MLNLIKLEFYKLKKQRVFKMLLLAVIAISAFSAYSEIRMLIGDEMLGSGKVGFANAFQDIFNLFIIAIFGGFYIGSDFSNKTIQSLLSQGHTRFEIVMSKTFVFFITTSIIMLFYPLTASLIHTLKFGWGDPFTIASLSYILRVIILGVILNIGTSSIFVLIAFLCRNISKTICISLAFPVLFSVINSTLGNMIPAVGKMIDYTTLSQLKNIVGDTIQSTTILTVLLSSSITIIIVISLSNLAFAKVEIR